MTQPGSLAEEAAKLAEAMVGWLSNEGLGGTGHSPECTVCPVCQLVRLARGIRPEAIEHLLDASASLVLALRSVVEAHEGGWASRPRGPVEHIDIS